MFPDSESLPYVLFPCRTDHAEDCCGFAKNRVKAVPSSHCSIRGQCSLLFQLTAVVHQSLTWVLRHPLKLSWRLVLWKRFVYVSFSVFLMLLFPNYVPHALTSFDAHCNVWCAMASWKSWSSLSRSSPMSWKWAVLQPPPSGTGVTVRQPHSKGMICNPRALV